MADGTTGHVLGVYPKKFLRSVKDTVRSLTALADIFLQVNILNSDKGLTAATFAVFDIMHAFFI